MLGIYAFPLWILIFYSVGVATKIFSSNLTFLREDISMLCRSFAIFFLFFFSPNTVTVFSPQLAWLSAYDICTVYCRPRWFTCMVNMLVLFYHVRDFYKWLFILCMLDNYLKKKHIKYIVYCGGSLIYSAQDCRAGGFLIWKIRQLSLLYFCNVYIQYCGQCPCL